MKISVIFLFLLVSLQATAQSRENVKHVMLIRNNHARKFIRITSNTMLLVVSQSGKSYSGKVVEVNSDTIIFEDTYFRISEISKLFLQNGPVMHSPFPSGPGRPAYLSGSSNFQVICPPDSVYSSRSAYQAFYSSLLTEFGKKTNDANNPMGVMEAATGNTTQTRHYENFLKWNVSKLGHLEIALAYERVIVPNLTWENEFSVIFGVQGADAYYMNNIPLYNYNGFSITTYPKYYLPNHKAYLSMVFMYRYLWATGIRTDWPGQAGSSGNGKLQDQYRDDYGLSIRVGWMKRTKQFIVDFYAGAGIKYVALHQLVYGYYRYHDSESMGWYNPDHSPDVYDKGLISPVLNLGVKIGVAF
ncbi:MAG: hypothetical protein ACOYNC_01625 [Bacteroidales bacterium]